MAEERFGVTKADWPVYKLLPKGQPDAPVDYDGPITVEGLLGFIGERAGVVVGEGGRQGGEL